jgi:PAS domain S-box-containing protein
MENDLSRVVDALPGLVWTALSDGGVDFVNQRWCNYTGLGVGEACGQGWQTAIHPEDLPELLDRWPGILASGGPGEMEARLRGVDGAYRWFLLRISPLADASGQTVKWCGINTDIDDRRRAEALLAGEKRLLEMVARGHAMRGILEALCQFAEATANGCHCSIVLVDSNGAHLEHGAAPSLPVSFTDAINGRPVNADSGPCAMAAHLNQQVIAADLTWETRWSAYAWCPMALAHGLKACWSTPIVSAAGKVLGAFAIYYTEPGTPTPEHQTLIEQITNIASIAIERAQSDTALKRSEAFLAEAQRLSSTGGFSWHVTTNQVIWSDEVYRIFEIEPAGPLTPDVTDSRVHPEDVPLLYEKVNRARIDGQDFEFEYRLVMPDRSLKYLHTVFHRTQDPDGQIEFVGAIQDVTERRRSEETLGKLRSELAHVTRVTTLGALTASIAHEVNQPLSGIITNAGTCLRMLAADPPNVDGARETARRTIRDGNRASDVITRLRALFAKKGVTSETVDLNEAAQEVLALARRELQAGRAILRSEFADDLPPVTGDRVQLQQVILNLLLNAADAMSSVDDRPRQLVVRTERDEGNNVRLIVKDSGVGFESEGVEKLFEAFYTTKNGGMGIGLAVSRSIIESHHGRLWAQVNDGPGVTFSFSIPSSPERATSAYRPEAVRAPAAINPEHVMRDQ